MISKLFTLPFFFLFLCVVFAIISQGHVLNDPRLVEASGYGFIASAALLVITGIYSNSKDSPEDEI